MSFFYLATPYSRYHAGLDAAYQAACEQAALLVAAGVPVFSPIAHTHGIGELGMLDSLDHDLWLKADEPFMEAASGLIVCQLPGWEQSHGISVEVEHFARAGKPIVYMEPGVVPHEVLPKRRRIIGLAGYAGVGKDTAAAALIADGWTRVAFADGIREAALLVNPIVTFSGLVPETLKELVSEVGWDAAKTFSDVRLLLQRMGTEAGRNIHGDDCWIKLAKRKIDAAPGNVVVTDVRFANEAAAIRSWGGTVIRIDRSGMGPLNDHTSESLDFGPDYVVQNNGTIGHLQAAIRTTPLLTRNLNRSSHDANTTHHRQSQPRPLQNAAM